MGIIQSVFSFLWGCLKKVGGIFAAIPSKLAVVVAGLSAVVTEIVSFVESLEDFFSGLMTSVESYFHQLVELVSMSQLFSMLVYCTALDDLASILAEVVGLCVTVLTFLFVTLAHVVLIFFGLRFGYNAYKYLVTSFTNGLSKA